MQLKSPPDQCLSSQCLRSQCSPKLQDSQIPQIAILILALEISSYSVEVSGACWLPVHSVSHSSCWTFYGSLFWVQLVLALYECSYQQELKHSPSTQLRPILRVCNAENHTTYLPEQ